MIMNMLESSKVVDIFLKYDVSKTRDSSKYKLTELDGITNTSLIVEVDSKKFVLRIPGENPDVIDRESEKHNTLLVQEEGLTLPFIIFDEENGIKISEYYEIYTYKDKDFKDPVLRNNAFQELKKLHNSEIVFQNNFKPTEVFISITDKSNPLEEEAKEVGLQVVQKLNEIGLEEKPCHQDLYSRNFVVHKDKTLLIDWEYSSMGDSYFDYADLFWQNNFETEIDLKNKSLDELGISTADEIEKFEYFEILSMITWGLWAMRRSPYDNDGKMSLNKALDKANNKKP